MKDIYDPNLEQRIHEFLGRKTRKYPELRLFEGHGPENPHKDSRRSVEKPPRVIVHGV